MMSTTISLRLAEPEDAPLVHQLLYELAEYEKLTNRFVVTEETIRDWISRQRIEVLIAESENNVAGLALYYFTVSTFPGVECIYLEDLFVRPEFRKHGIGSQFFTELIRIAKERNCPRIEWMVLDWNESGMAFYHKLGAKPVDDWKTYRLEI